MFQMMRPLSPLFEEKWFYICSNSKGLKNLKSVTQNAHFFYIHVLCKFSQRKTCASYGFSIFSASLRFGVVALIPAVVSISL